MKSSDAVDVQASILKGRRIPCICQRQFEDVTTPIGRAVSYSMSRGYVVERVECRVCYRAWTRLDPG